MSRARLWLQALALGLAAWPMLAVRAQQEVGVERPGPPPREDFETDIDHNGIPDGGWYNLLDVRLMPSGGVVGRHCLRFESDSLGRQARISRAFGVDGKKTEALIIGLWIRLERIEPGERVGDVPGLAIQFYGPQLKTVGRESLGPWTKTFGSRWIHVAKRLPVPPDTLDAIMSFGLLGATGVMEVDGLTIEEVETGGKSTRNLVLNGDFELGDPNPFGWVVEHGAHRAFPGNRSNAALELTGSGSRAMNGLGMPVERFGGLDISMASRGTGLRGAGGARAAVFFLDGDGRVLPGLETGVPVFRWSGSFDWHAEQLTVPVPQGAVRAFFQIEKSDGVGTLWVDDVKIAAQPDPREGSWTPYQVQTDTRDWRPVEASPKIEPRSALDATYLLQSRAGNHGFVEVREGRLAFGKGGRARFFGVVLLAPTAFQEPDQSEALAERLARSGVNLVRLGDLDTPLGPGRSLFDDTRDDTQALDPLALSRLDSLIAALKKRGIYVALELQGSRRFRSGDEVPGYRTLPPGGGPAAAFDPRIRELALKAAKDLLTHVNPHTGLALYDDPVLAWITLSGELTIFDLIEHPDELPPEMAEELKSLAQKHGGGSTRRFWQATESAQWKALADGLREINVKVPIAGCSHFRRGPAEFVAAQVVPGLDFIDDRLFWPTPIGALPNRQSIVRDLKGGLITMAATKRHTDRPYVIGQFCDFTDDWALPYEGTDLMLAAHTAAADDWDALVRRAVFIFPEVWGANATGTGGREDVYRIPEVINGNPQVFALLPHAASLLLREPEAAPKTRPPGRPAGARRGALPGWDPAAGRLVIDTPYTQGLAGWVEGPPVNLDGVAIDVDTPYAVIMATAVGPDPIASAHRLLVTAVGRVEPTGLRYVDQWQRDVAAPGSAPLLQEPVRARVVWKRQGKIKAFALDNTGARRAPVSLEKIADGVRLPITGTTSTLHWELVVE